MPTHDTKVYTGNGKVGDQVWLVSWPPSPPGSTPAHGCTITKCVITKVGMLNSHGYRLNIQVKPEGAGRRLVVSPFADELPDPDGNRVLIFPPPRELPADLRKWAKTHRVHLLRKTNNSDELRYLALCAMCLQPVYKECTVVDACELRFYATKAGGQREVRAYVDEDGEVTYDDSKFVCSCPDVDYPAPPGLED